jgi:phage recombination protein Bet
MTDSALIAAPVLSEDSRRILDGLMVVRETLAPDLTPGELQLFALVASRSGLDPFARQIYAVKRMSRGQSRMAIQTGIDGYRSIAARTGEYDGQDEPIYGADCGCGRGNAHPEYATVRVYRKGMSRPVGATAFWHEYVPDAGQSGQGDVMWRKMPHVMVAKVASQGVPVGPELGQGHRLGHLHH